MILLLAIISFFFLRFVMIIHATNKKDEKPLLQVESPTVVKPKYENKYIIHDGLKDVTTAHNDYKRRIVIEYTPIGNVLMKFNPARESFEYYSDKGIPYAYLQTVARKFVITFQCPSLYSFKKTNRYTHMGKFANCQVLNTIIVRSKTSYKQFKTRCT